MPRTIAIRRPLEIHPRYRLSTTAIRPQPRSLWIRRSRPRSPSEGERAGLRETPFTWAQRDHNRVTMPDEWIAAYAGGRQLRSDILIGYWDEVASGSK